MNNFINTTQQHNCYPGNGKGVNLCAKFQPNRSSCGVNIYTYSKITLNNTYS